MYVHSNTTEKWFKDWLYGPWDEDKYNTYKVLNSIPVVHDYMDYLLDVRADSEYLNRYGMDYTSIHDPRRLSQSNSSRSLMRSVSANVGSLYTSGSKFVKKSKRGSRSRRRR